MADTHVTDDEEHGDRYGNPTTEPSARSVLLRTLFVIGMGFFAAFWIWALFFASKTAVNKIDDRAWAERAESICAEVKPQIRQLDLEASPDLVVRADLVVQSTDMLSVMLDDITAVTPEDARGVPITERIETFAGDNEMPSCAPPRGSVV
ncbi:MAG: hypothetical protein IZT58_17385 [Actinobacteria bacterium]|nr:hypothetical protein [Actinomycetota bacterium]